MNQAGKKRATSIQRSLFLNMVVLIVLISGAILVAAYLTGTRSTRQSGAMARIKSTVDTTEDRLRLLFQGVTDQLLIVRAWGAAGMFSSDAGAQLNALFMPVIEKTPYVSAMMIADERGREWRLERDGDGWLTRFTEFDRGRAAWSRWTKPGSSPEAKPVDTWTDTPARDPRDQVWYIGAINTHFDGLYWTRPYAFGAAGDPGITAATRFDSDGDGSPDVAAAFDVRLIDISDFTTGFYVSERGKTIVFTDDGTVIGLPRVDVFDGAEGDRPAIFSSVEDLKIPEISAAVARWMTEMEQRGEHFRFDSGGESWWGGFRNFEIGPGRTFWIGAVVPESDFGTWADVWRNTTLLITAIALGLAMLLATVLAHRYGGPLRSLAGASRSMRMRAEGADSSSNSSPTGGALATSPADDAESFEIQGSGIREIDELADDFTRMAVQVEQKSRELEEYSHTLEEKVAERTADLNRKNAELVETLDRLHETQQQLLLQEKMASLGNLVAGVAHELNTPIGAMVAAADVSRRCCEKLSGLVAEGSPGSKGAASPDLHKVNELLVQNISLIRDGGRRVSAIVRNLKDFSRLDEAEFQPADLHEGLDSTVNLVQHLLKNRIEVQKDYGDIPEIMCHPNELNQVFMNLLTNASQAIEGKGRITIRTSANRENVTIKVADTGHGIAPEDRTRVFEPGFTTRGVGVGTGLGLAISHQIVSKHGGSIRIESEIGGGSEITVQLPIRHEQDDAYGRSEPNQPE